MSVETFGIKRDAAHVGKERVENLQALRGIASLMVVFYHLGLAELKIFGAGALCASVTASWNSGVDLFFVISGFVMVMISADRFHQPGDARTFFLRRAARVYPLYWFYTLVYLAFSLATTDILVIQGGISVGSVVRSLLLLPGATSFIVFSGWTLAYELYFYLVFAFALRWPESGRMVIIAAWGAIMVASASLAPDFSKSSPVTALLTSSLNLEFVAGCGVAWIVSRGFNRFSIPALICAVAMFVGASFIQQPGMHVLLYTPAASLLVYGAVSVEALHRCHFPLWLRYVGNISYSLYLSHLLTLSLIRHLWITFHLPQNVGGELIFVATGAVCSVAVGAVSYHWVEKPLLARAYAAVPRIASLVARKSASVF